MEIVNKDHIPNESTMAIIPASAFYEHNFGNLSLISEGVHGMSNEHHQNSKSSSVSSPSSTDSNALGYQVNVANYNLSEEGNSIISFKPDCGNFLHASGSFFSFDQQSKNMQIDLCTKMSIGGEEDHEYPSWGENLLHCNSYQNQLNPKWTTNHGLPETSNSHHEADVDGFRSGGVQSSWMGNQEANIITNGIQELGMQDANNYKRPSTGENVLALKKQRVVTLNSDSKKSKSKCASTSKDPQSVAAKNRRERISERLKVLRDLVPNGSKVDIVTMLEKAISYVKFLQLQVKVLATDEFWPAQGGKAPDLSQVREAIDAILASQRDINLSSK